MILRNRHSTSYDLASLFRGRRCSLDRWMEWKNRKTHWYKVDSSALNFPFLKDVSQNCFVFDVVNFEKLGSLAELLRFWWCQVQKLRTSRRNVSFLMLSSSKAEDVSQNCCVFKLIQTDRQTDKQTGRQADRQIDNITTPTTTLHYCYNCQYKYTTLHYTTLITLQHTTTTNATTTTVHYTTLRCTDYVALHHNYNYNYNCSCNCNYHYITLHYTTLHYATLHCTALHYSSRYTTHTTLNYTALHCTTTTLQLHYLTLGITPHHDYSSNCTCKCTH